MRTTLRYQFRFCFLPQFALLAGFTILVFVLAFVAGLMEDPPDLLTIYLQYYAIMLPGILAFFAVQAGSIHMVRALSFGMRRRDYALGFQMLIILWLIVGYGSFQIVYTFRRARPVLPTGGLAAVSNQISLPFWVYPLLLLGCLILGAAAGVLRGRRRVQGVAFQVGTMVLLGFSFIVGILLLVVGSVLGEEYVRLGTGILVLSSAIAVLLGEWILWRGLQKFSL